MKCTIKSGEKLVEKVIIKTEFLPLCYSYNHNFIAVGSNAGILTVYQIHSLEFCFFFLAEVMMTMVGMMISHDFERFQ